MPTPATYQIQWRGTHPITELTRRCAIEDACVEFEHQVWVWDDVDMVGSPVRLTRIDTGSGRNLELFATYHRK